MERLLSSPPPISLLPSRVQRQPRYPFPSRFGRDDPPKLASARTESRRVGFVSCSNESAPSGHPSSMDKPPPLWTRRVDSPLGSVPTSRFLRQNATGDSRKLKVLNFVHLKIDSPFWFHSNLGAALSMFKLQLLFTPSVLAIIISP